MRTLAAIPMVLVLFACDKDQKAKELVETVVGDSGPPVMTPPPRVDSGAPAATATASASAVPMPERPIPKPQTTVGAGAPQETQMKAIGYMFAMRAPHPDDAAVDDKYVEDLVAKLKPVVLAMDKGPDKAKWNRVETQGKGRQIDLLMSDGCDAKTPFNAVVQRANTPLAALLAHGVLAIRCNDTKHQCYQSTRDPDDVLCATGIRHTK